MEARSPRPLVARSTVELAALVSVLAATAALVLHRYVGVGELPLVLGSFLVASALGWTQPALRGAPRRRASLAPVPVRSRDRRHEG